MAIRAITDALRGDIEKALAASTESAKTAGASAGKNYSDEFKGATGDAIGPDFSHVVDSAKQAGKDAGAGLSQGITDSTHSINTGGSHFDSVVAEARTAGDRAGKELSAGVKAAASDLEQAGNDGGNRVGNGFSKGFSGSAAKNGIDAIGSRMLALIPIIAVLVTALSSLASGLFAIGAAASPAAAGIAVLPGLAAAAATAFGALKSAFGGIGSTLKAYSSEQTNAGKTSVANARALESAHRAVANAQRGVADAARSNAEALRNADRAIGDARQNLSTVLQSVATRQADADRSLFIAERNLSDALTTQRDAQVGLTEARRKAREEIIALRFAAEDAALSQESASISLERARRQLQLVSGLPPDNLLRREAELSYKQAQLSVRKTAESYKESSAAVDKANKAGVEGSKTVLDAKKREQDANRSVADASFALAKQQRDNIIAQRDATLQVARAQRDVADAETNRQKVSQENARRSENAQQALADAMRAQGDAVEKAGGSLSAYQLQLAALTPAQRDFVKYIVSIKDELKQVKIVASDNILPGVKIAIEDFLKGGLFPIFISGISGVSKQIGSFFVQLGTLTKSPFFQGNFQKVMDSSAVVTGHFGSILISLVKLFFTVAAAAVPMTQRFTEWIDIATGNWADKAGANQDKMTKFFEHAGDVAAQLGRIVSNVAVGIFKLGQTAQTGGQTLLTSFELATQKFRALTDGTDNQAKFKKFFEDVATNVQKLGDLFNAVATEFFKLGDDPGIGQLAATLTTDVIPALGTLIKTISDQAGPAIGELLGDIAKVLTSLQDSPALSIFLGILTTFGTVAVWVASNPVGQALIITLSSIFAATRALSIVRKISMLDKLTDFFGKIRSFDIGKLKDKITGFFSASSKAAGDAATGIDKGTKSINDTLDGKGGKKKVTAAEGAAKRAAGTGISPATEAAASGFGGNLDSLTRKFVTTGEAKDLFIVNLERLRLKFLQMSGAGAVGGVGGKSKSSAASAAANVADDINLGGAAGGAAKAGTAAEKAAASGGKLSKVFGGLGKAAGALSLGLFGVEAATLAALAPFLLIGAALAVVALIFKGAWDHSEVLRKSFDEKLRPAFSKLWVAIAPIVAVMKQFISEGLKALGDILGNYVIPAVAAFVTFVAEAIPKVIKFFIGLILFVKDIPQKLKDLGSNIWGWITDGLSAAWDFVVSIWNNIVSFVGGIPAQLLALGSTLWTWITDGLNAAWSFVVNIWNNILAFVGAIPAQLAALGSTLWGWITGGLSAAGELVSSIWDGIIGFVTGIPGKLAALAATLWGWITTALALEVRGLEIIWNAIVTFVTGIPKAVARAGAKIWGWISNALDIAHAAIKVIWGKIVSFVGGIPATIGRVASSMWTGITNGVGNIYNSIVNAFNHVLSFLGRLGGGIARVAVHMWDGIIGSFKNVINGIISVWNNLSFGVPGFDVFGKHFDGFRLDTPNIPTLAAGGTVSSANGGTLALLAEAGRDERVTPLNARGLSKGEELVLELLAQGSQNRPNVHIDVHAAPGMDVETLARQVSRELGFLMG